MASRTRVLHPRRSLASQRCLSNSASPALNSMDTLLSEPPLFLKESALSQLPFFSESRVDGYDLPPRPPNVCGDCWEGVFAMHLGLSCVSPRDVQRHRGWSKEIQYSTSGVELASREENCIWCKFVLHEGWSTRPHDLEWTIRVRGAVHKYIPDDSDERHCYQGVTVNINGEERYKGYVYAAPGASGYIKALQGNLVWTWRLILDLVR